MVDRKMFLSQNARLKDSRSYLDIFDFYSKTNYLKTKGKGKRNVAIMMVFWRRW